MADAIKTIFGGFMRSATRDQGKQRAKLAREDRTGTYMARVDAHMADMSREEKLKFLHVELEKWFERYKNFSNGVMRGEPLTSTATAWDYSETIGALSVKIGSVERLSL